MRLSVFSVKSVFLSERNSGSEILTQDIKKLDKYFMYARLAESSRRAEIMS